MSGFVMHLQSPARYERFAGVLAFSGRDTTGSFGILPGRYRLITCLELGLASFRMIDAPVRYLALSGGVLYFLRNELFINTRRYLIHPDLETISRELDEQLRTEDEAMKSARSSVRQLDDAMMRRLWELGRRGERWPHGG